jgi:hypothetical protein
MHTAYVAIALAVVLLWGLANSGQYLALLAG